eukprot:IDg225t1
MLETGRMRRQIIKCGFCSNSSTRALFSRREEHGWNRARSTNRDRLDRARIGHDCKHAKIAPPSALSADQYESIPKARARLYRLFCYNKEALLSGRTLCWCRNCVGSRRFTQTSMCAVRKRARSHPRTPIPGLHSADEGEEPWLLFQQLK